MADPREELQYAIAGLNLAKDRQQRRAAQRRIDAIMSAHPALRAEVEYRSWCAATDRAVSERDFEVWMASRGFVRNQNASDDAPGAGASPSTPPSGEGRSAGADGPSPEGSSPADDSVEVLLG